MKNILPFLLLLSCSTQESIEEVTNLDKVDSIVWWEIQNDSVKKKMRNEYNYKIKTDTPEK
jgi:hypothetical protein